MQTRNKPAVSAYEIRTGGIETACACYGLGQGAMRKAAEDAHAVIRIGKRYLINFEKVDEYMNSISE